VSKFKSIIKAVFGGGSSQPAPTQPTVDPEAERRKVEAESAAKANEQLLADARRKRQQKGLLASGEEVGAGSVLSSGKPSSKAVSTVLGGGGV
jgi:hypothetical protein